MSPSVFLEAQLYIYDPLDVLFQNHWLLAKLIRGLSVSSVAESNGVIIGRLQVHWTSAAIRRTMNALFCYTTTAFWNKVTRTLKDVSLMAQLLLFLHPQTHFPQDGIKFQEILNWDELFTSCRNQQLSHWTFALSAEHGL